MSVNIRGLMSKKETLCNIIHGYSMDFIALQETHVCGNSKINIPGFYCFSKNRPSRGSKGGVAILVREIYKEAAVLIHESEKCELIAIKMCNMRPNLCILNYYAKQENSTPPGIIHENLSEVFGLAKRLTNEGNAVFIAGDWNVLVGDKALPGNNPVVSRGGKIFNDLLAANEDFELLNCRNDGPCATHIDASGGRGNCLDLVVANNLAADSVAGFIVDDETNKIITPYRYLHRTGRRRYTDHLALHWEMRLTEVPEDHSKKYTVWNFAKKLGDGKFAYTLERQANNLVKVLNKEKDINVIMKRVLTEVDNARHRGYGKRLMDVGKWKMLEDERIEMFRLGEIKKAVEKAKEEAKSTRVPLQIFQMRKTHLMAERGEVFSSVRHPETGRIVETRREINEAVRRHNEITLDQNVGQPEAYQELTDFKIQFIELAKLKKETERDETIQFEDYLDTLDILIKKKKNCYADLKKWGPKFRIFIYWLMRRIYETEEIPDLFLKTNLQALYKNKGSRKDLGNYRFLHMKDGLAKLFEALVMRKCKAQLWKHFAETQVGGLPNSRTTEHLYVIITLMAMCEWKLEWSPEGAVVIFKDIRKAFDKIKAVHTIYSSARAGLEGRPLRLVEKLNRETTFEVIGDDDKTEFSRDWIGGQGTIFTATSCSKTLPEPMDDLTAAWEEEHREDLGVRLGPEKLLINDVNFVDDEAAVCKDAESARVKGKLIQLASEQLNVEVHPQKTKYFLIGKKDWVERTDEDLKHNPIIIKGNIVERSTCEKYLGMMMNDGGVRKTVEEQMKFRIAECNGKLQQLMILMDKPTMLEFGYLAGLRTVFESVMTSTATYSAGTWLMRKKDYDWIDKEQKRLLFTMVRVHSKVTVKHLLFELGMIPWSWIVKRDKVTFISFLCQGKSGQASKLCTSEARAELTKGLVCEAKAIAAEVGLPDPTKVLISAEMAGEAVKEAAREDMWESVVESRWTDMPVLSEAYSPDYIYDTDLTGHQQKIFLNFRLGILNFKRRYPRKFNNVECVWTGCREDDTYGHSLVCKFNKLKRPENNNNVHQVIKYLEELSKVREPITGLPLYSL